MIIIWDWDELSIHQSVCLMWYTCTNGMCFLIRELFSRHKKIHFLNKNILHSRYSALKNLMSSEADITSIKIWVKKKSVLLNNLDDGRYFPYHVEHKLHFILFARICNLPQGERKLIFIKWQQGSPSMADIYILYSLRKWIFLAVG